MTAIEKTASSLDHRPPGVPASSRRESSALAEEVLQSLPPAVARRLKSLINRHEAGKSLTADELAEARGLLDIAEYFVVQRMRNRLGGVSVVVNLIQWGRWPMGMTQNQLRLRLLADRCGSGVCVGGFC